MAPSLDYSDSKDEASSASLLSESSDSFYDRELPARPRSRSSAIRWAAVLVISILSTNIMSIFITSHVVSGRHKSVSEPPTGVAPLLSGLPLDPKPRRVNTPFYDSEDSIYRKHEKPETEAAWTELTQIRMCPTDALQAWLLT